MIKTTNNIFLIHSIVLFAFYSIFCSLSNKKKRKEIYGNNSYCYSKLKNNSLFFLAILVSCLSSIAIWYQYKDYNLYEICISIKNSNNIWIAVAYATPILEFCVICIMNALASGMIYTYSKLYSFTKYAIDCELFEYGKEVGYVVAETEKELLLKCDDSYPVILRKDLINAYMLVPNETKMCGDNIIFPKEYKGLNIFKPEKKKI